MIVEAGGERQASENSESLQDNPEGWKRSDYEEARESSYVDHIITTQRSGLSQHYGILRLWFKGDVWRQYLWSWQIIYFRWDIGSFPNQVLRTVS